MCIRDSIGDVFLLKYALGNLRAQGKVKKPLPVYLPAAPEEIAGQFAGPEFELHWVHREERHRIGETGVTFEEMTHPVPSYAVKIEAGGKTFVYSGDTNKNSRLAKFAAGADLFLVDGGLLSGGAGAPHLTAKEAAQIAREAGAKKTIITHLSPLYEEEEYGRQAGSRAEIAKPGAYYQIE